MIAADGGSRKPTDRRIADRRPASGVCVDEAFVDSSEEAGMRTESERRGMGAGRSAVARLAAVGLCGLLAAGCGGDESGGEAAAGGGESGVETTRLADAGFRGPESVLHDAEADAYLVSNINGEPTAADGNGFISRVSPDGTVAELKWIDGAAEGVTLNAPKGSAIAGDSLYVADIDCVRVFVRTTGEHSHDICFEDATFLNDITVDANGDLWMTDTGTEGSPGAVYRFNAEGDRAAVLDEEESGPNGITFTPRGLLVVTSGSGEIFRLAADGTRTPITPRSDRRLDGIVFRQDESFFFSNWADSTVYKVGGDGSVERLVQDVPSPADIGYDARRHRLLIPLLQENALVMAEVEGPGATPAAGDTGSAGSASGGAGGG